MAGEIRQKSQQAQIKELAQLAQHQFFVNREDLIEAGESFDFFVTEAATTTHLSMTSRNNPIQYQKSIKNPKNQQDKFVFFFYGVYISD